MNVLLRGVRVIDPARGRDEAPRDVLLRDGVLSGIDSRIEAETGVQVVDLARSGGDACVVCPGFVDLHAHLREPGGEDAETVVSGARAAAAGGFTTVLAMANTRPPIDTAEGVRDAVERARTACITVHQVAAVSLGLGGERLVDVAACTAAGAVAFSDDGRNRAGIALLSDALRQADDAGRPVLVHCEDERAIAGDGDADPVRSPHRPSAAEVAAVRAALTALRDAGGGRLHLQHVSTAGAVALLREARERGIAVTAEATPHHLAVWPRDVRERLGTDPLLKVNPPLRDDDDRRAVLAAVRDGTIDAVATDHAPHAQRAKSATYEGAAPGMTGLETALAACITLADLGGDATALLVERLTLGPWSVLRDTGMVPRPELRIGEPASLTLFDPSLAWTPSPDATVSRSRNTPLLGVPLRGRVLLTVHRGVAVHRDAALPRELAVSHA